MFTKKGTKKADELTAAKREAMEKMRALSLEELAKVTGGTGETDELMKKSYFCPRCHNLSAGLECHSCGAEFTREQVATFT